MQIEREPDRCTFAGKFVEKSCFIVLNREVSKLESNHKIKENLLFKGDAQFPVMPPFNYQEVLVPTETETCAKMFHIFCSYF